MSVLSRITQELPQVFRTLIDRYGFALQVEGEHRLFLRSPRCVIDITFERYEGGFRVDLGDPCDEHDRHDYDYLLVMAMRRPDYRGSVRRYDDSLSEEQVLRLRLGALRDNLVRYCSDLLAGDFASIRQEGYHELAAYIKARMPMVLNMPADDPIKAKFWRGDYTWARDLQEREHAESTSTTP